MNLRHLVMLLMVVVYAHAQNDQHLEQRVTDRAKGFSAAQFLSATRYVPVMIARGLGTWSSPPLVLEIDGMPYAGFPLNLVSPDYAPIDLIRADSISIVERPVLTKSGMYPGGIFSIRTSKIPDSLTITGRVFGGSETGDVILEEYTGKSLPFYNRNKIGFSGAAAVSDRTGNLRYRLMGGGFTYFSVGYADRDRILIPYIDLPTFSRPNRHFLGSLELEYALRESATVSIFGGLNSFDSWEHVPFLPTFALFSGTTGTLRLSAHRIIPFLDVFARRDMVSLTMREQLGTEGGEYSGSVTAMTLVPGFSLGDRVQVLLPVEYQIHTVEVPDQNRQFFRENTQLSTWSAALQLGIQGDRWHGFVQGRFEKGVNGSSLLSGAVSLTSRLSEHHALEVHASSLETSPTLLELYGVFSTWRFRPAIGANDTFRIAGNANMRSERTSGVQVDHLVEMNPRIRTTAFINRIENLITREPTRIIRSSMPGDIVYSGNYVNRGTRVLGGLEFSVQAGLSENVEVEAWYTMTENSPAREIPRHRLLAKTSLNITNSTTGQIVIRGASKTVWAEFAINASDDDKSGVGTDGVVPQYWSVDCSVVQNLGGIFFLREVTGRIEMQNILNRTLRTFPLGVTYDLSVIGYLSFRI